MKHVVLPSDACVLRLVERRILHVLRALQAGPAATGAIRDELEPTLGGARTARLLDAFSEFLGLVARHAWVAPVILPPASRGYAQDELTLVKIILDATEQRREQAWVEASFVVSAAALLPLLGCAERGGLILLCEECRMRVRGRA